LRIGTWNLAGRWTNAHEDFLSRLDCDIWLLTEVSERLSLDGYHLHRSEQRMADKRRWAAVLSPRPFRRMPDPHAASAMVQFGELTVCSSILPWRSCGTQAPWTGTRHADKTEAAVLQLDKELPLGSLIWGGDWNHAMTGTEYAGSVRGRQHLLDVLSGRGMRVPTADLPHQIDGLLAIDHIALTEDLVAKDAVRVPVHLDDSRRLSDHDCYVVTLTD
jgi:hypothetical protein